MSDHDQESDRDEAADAIRARQSLEGEANPADDPTGHPYTTGERLGALGDFEETDADEALDDDDVELEE
jgi:hypothetical protein